jgi:hypothetical protein
MSLQDAMLFLRDARDDDGLRALLKQRRLTLDLPALVALGVERGWQFSEDDLRSAFGLDWKLRAARRFTSGGSARSDPS